MQEENRCNQVVPGKKSGKTGNPVREQKNFQDFFRENQGNRENACRTGSYFKTRVPPWETGRKTITAINVDFEKLLISLAIFMVLSFK